MHAHESPKSMTGPLIVLAVPSLLLGWLMHRGHWVDKLFTWPGVDAVEIPHFVSYIASGCAIGGLLLGAIIYLGRWGTHEKIAAVLKPLHVLFTNKWYVDEIYQIIFVKPLFAFCRVLATFDDQVLDRVGVDGLGWMTEKVARLKAWFDDHVVDGSANGSAVIVRGVGGMLRSVQNGLVQNYLLLVTLGFVALLFWKIF